MNIETFRTLNRLVLVKPKDNMTKDEVSEMGIILTLAANKSIVGDRPTNGIVVKIGNKCRDVKVGDEVFFPVHVGQDMEFEDGSYILMDEPAILGYRPQGV